ncbi:hypothetical protein [Micromonospora sp. CPCC 206061]|uniref:hypothetical protein n=1 Tax=Micromonospora sp. CPCC 206061 TaxID=3122410 RepID=UPI002FF42695
MGDSDGVWISSDGGRHFARDTTAPGDGTAGSASGRLWTIDHATQSAYLTDDGRTWTSIPLPPAE